MKFNDIMVLFGLGFLISLVIVAIILFFVWIFRHKIMMWFAQKQINKAIEIFTTIPTEEKRVEAFSKANINNKLVVQNAYKNVIKQGGTIQNGNANIREEASTSPTKPRKHTEADTRRAERPTRQRDISPRTATFAPKANNSNSKPQR